MKHTKGKWIMNDSSLHLNQEFKIIASNNEGEWLIAKVENSKLLPSEANAKLISKAPEMYDMLLNIVNSEQFKSVKNIYSHFSQQAWHNQIQSLLNEIEK